MADLVFGCTGASAERYAATPTLSFALTITESTGVARARDRPALPDPHRAAATAVLRRRGEAAARPVRRHLALGRHGQADPARDRDHDGARVHRADRDRGADALHLRPRGGVRAVPAGAGRRDDSAAAAVQRHRLPGPGQRLLGRAGAVELRGVLPDARERLAATWSTCTSPAARGCGAAARRSTPCPPSRPSARCRPGTRRSGRCWPRPRRAGRPTRRRARPSPPR